MRKDGGIEVCKPILGLGTIPKTVNLNVFGNLASRHFEMLRRFSKPHIL